MMLLIALLVGSARTAAQDHSTVAEGRLGSPDLPSRTVGKVAQPVDPVPEYTIGERDVLDITVWHEKELSGTVVVRPDGKITVPLVNELYVLGMTPPQLQADITAKLARFVTAPQVTVTVRQINSRRVFVIGEVVHRGAFPISARTTVLQLLAEAGGLTEYAKAKKVYVLRTENGKQTRMPFNYEEVIKGKGSQEVIVLHPGDVIVVP